MISVAHFLLLFCMARAPKRQPIKRKISVIHPPGLDRLLIDEAERFMAKQGKQIPPPVLRRLPYLVFFVRDPNILLSRDGLLMPEGQSIFAKAYARNPEVFLQLMLHLTRFYAHLGPILRALRENWIITFKDRGFLIKKPINDATTHELVAFIRTHYAAKVAPKTVARCKERLAIADASINDPIVTNALRIFTALAASKTQLLTVPGLSE